MPLFHTPRKQHEFFKKHETNQHVREVFTPITLSTARIVNDLRFCVYYVWAFIIILLTALLYAQFGL